MITTKYKALSREIALEAMQEAGIQWDGEQLHHAGYVGEQRFDFVFFGLVPKPQTEEQAAANDPVEFYPGFHFDVLGPARLDFGPTIEVKENITNPFHKFA